MLQSNFLKTLVFALPLLIAGCGGGGGSSGSAGGTGIVSVAITDGPVDDVTQIVVEFDGATFKPVDGEQVSYDFEPRQIDLKALNNGKFEILFEQEVPAGVYEWIKLDVNADFDEDPTDSYVVTDTGEQIELRVPPGKLKLGNEFTVFANGQSAFVIEWNLRMGLTNPVGQPGYKLQPSLRITDMNMFGTIAGTVAAELLPPIDESCTSDPNTGDGNVVYIYAGSDVIPDDIDGIEPEPYTTADVRLNDVSGNNEYLATFLPPGPYTVAFTCQGQDDMIPDPDMPDIDTDDEISFTSGQNAQVSDGLTTTINFVAPVPEPEPLPET
jgi:hypothetical protein